MVVSDLYSNNLRFYDFQHENCVNKINQKLKASRNVKITAFYRKLSSKYYAIVKVANFMKNKLLISLCLNFFAVIVKSSASYGCYFEKGSIKVCRLYGLMEKNTYSDRCGDAI